MNNPITEFKDIYPIEHINISDSHSNIYYLIAIAITFILVTVIIKKFRKRKTDPNIKALKSLNLNSKVTKETLYKFTLLAKSSVKAEQKERLNKILKNLEPLKYKQNTPIIEQEIIDDIKRYISDATR